MNDNAPLNGSKIRSSDPSGPLSYSFAKRHGVLLAPGSDGGQIVHCRHSTSQQILLETQRFGGALAAINIHSDDEFDRLLGAFYDAERSSATMIADDLGDRYDLATLARQLPPPEDLLDENASAPIVRLINALLAEAIRQSGSDIHLEPYADKLVCASA